jgi:meso-butanediol dehydrogenase/(S,S)-butanediol dehydrogenase/diacetyl reductase
MDKKVAVVFGSSGEMGSCCVRSFKKINFQVVGVDLKLGKDNIDLQFTGDVKDPNFIDLTYKEIVLKFGHIDCVVNTISGQASSYNKSDSLVERFNAVIDNDLRSAYIITEAAVQHMKSTGGNIVHVGSIAGQVLGSKSMPYAMTKSAIIGLVKSAARLYGHFDIKVNAVAPGILGGERTETAEHEVKFGYNTAILNQTPLKRWGTNEEISSLITFIGSNGCPFLTGQTIIVDGGATLTCGLRVDSDDVTNWQKFQFLGEP